MAGDTRRQMGFRPSQETHTMKKVSYKSTNGQGVSIAAVIHFPGGFDERKTHQAVVVAHPGA